MAAEVLTSAVLSRAGYVHGFSTKSDDPTLLLTATLGIYRARLYLVNQVHGARVVRAEGTPNDVRNIEADALVARAGPNAVAVQTADCVPVLIGSLDGPACAAVHAGWRGVVAGVVPAAIEDMRGLGSKGFVAAIGPCIGPCCFEVGADVAAQIAAAAPGADVVAREEGDKRWVDLRRAVRAQLVALGVEDENIEDVPGCTKCDPEERFFSYRRDGAQDAEEGRQLSVIRGRSASAYASLPPRSK